jgi:Ca2+/Na+ antiporter
MGPWSQFFSTWLARLKAPAIVYFSFALAIVSVLSWANLDFQTYWWRLVLFVLILALLVSTLYLPAIPKRIESLLKTEINPIDLSNLSPSPDKRIALVGLSEAGKSSFRNRLAGRIDDKQTNKWLAEIFLIPTNSGNKKLALIDTVGGRKDQQLLIPTVEKSMMLFLDHNPSAHARSFLAERKTNHLVLVKELAKIIEDETVVCEEVILVANKADLWSGNKKHLKDMGTLMNDVETILKAANPKIRIRKFTEHSNFDSDSVIKLSKFCVDV